MSVYWNWQCVTNCSGVGENLLIIKTWFLYSDQSRVLDQPIPLFVSSSVHLMSGVKEEKFSSVYLVIGDSGPEN